MIVDYVKLLRRHRGIKTPCPACRGWGRKEYASGSTWRGGYGENQPTMDVCDVCWGTGDKHDIGCNLRLLTGADKRSRDEEAYAFFREALGEDGVHADEYLASLSVKCSELGRLWDDKDWSQLASAFDRLAGGPDDR